MFLIGTEHISMLRSVLRVRIGINVCDEWKSIGLGG